MKVIFMGTPDFAVGALAAIYEAGHEITLVVTQPDKPKGRGKAVQYTPVKQFALERGLPVFQPLKIKAPEAVEELRKYEADIFVVAAFGQILSAEILYMPRFGSVNIHASLLPKYRGAAPIQWALIEGEKKTGVTIMQMNEGLDTGDMLLQKEVDITPEDTGESLHDKLRAAGAELIVKALPEIGAGRLQPVPQDDGLSCYAGRLSKSLGEISWEEDAARLERLIRALNPWPGCYTGYRGKLLKIWKAEAFSEADGDAGGEEAAPCGTVLSVSKDAIRVQTGWGVLSLKSVQPEGKKRMEVKDFLLGYPVKAGECFGEKRSDAL